ncbi:tyrosine-type recombinase/integrase [Sphingobium naphthae]|uniref:tyrosine-type recombinase/integrase n=1 Tax=Sphingobium naphthae TaxID=1886786 RepID=UPI003748D8BE
MKRAKSKGHVYYYFDTGQTDDDGKRIWKRLPDPADKAFAATYAAMLGHRARRQNVVERLTVAKLIDLYQCSDKFSKMADSTKRLYRLYQAELVDKLGTAPAQLVERKDIVLLLDQMADRPGAANMVKRSGGAAYAWARKRGHVTNDPFFEIEEMDTGEHEPWPEAALQLCLTAEDDIVRLTVHLLYYTAQRIGDVAAMSWRDIRDDAIHITQKKTGKHLIIPLHQELRKELARHSRSLTTIIPGKPMESKNNRLRLAMQTICTEAGFKIVPHGLRKNAVNALLEAGCSSAETAAISGQSLQMVEHYAKRRSQKKLGLSAMEKWERT